MRKLDGKMRKLVQDAVRNMLRMQIFDFRTSLSCDGTEELKGFSTCWCWQSLFKVNAI